MIAEYETYATTKADDLVSSHLPLVKRIASHLTAKLPPHIEIDDLIQVGLIGLLKAQEDYLPDSGASFSTYATIRIRGSMLDELRARDWVPRSVQKSLSRVAKAIELVEQRRGRAPSDSEVAAELGVSVSEYHDLLADVSRARLTSIDDVEGLESDGELESNVTNEMRSDALSDAIRELPEKEQLMMSLYYVDSMNLKEIGLILDVSESRVSQIHGQAIARLKTKLRAWT